MGITGGSQKPPSKGSLCALCGAKSTSITDFLRIPDLNINSLFFMVPIQSGQWDSMEEANNYIDCLIEAVQTSFVLFEQRNLIVLSLHYGVAWKR